MSIELESMAIEMPRVDGHPNRESFRGVLTLVDAVSDRPPAGARGHRVVLTRAAAEDALASLLGMALDYSPALDRHDSRRKVGVITSAEIIGRELQLAGYLFAKDFPEIVNKIANGSFHQSATNDFGAGRALSVASENFRHPNTALGMSYEITDARVADVRARIWTLTQITFTGAAILRRDKAAYRDTWIELV